MAAYYNEFHAPTAAWLRELIRRGLIADGEVDERSITDVSADDVRGFRQAHFFAGIGGWSLALRLAGWPDDRPVWTGSPPCQFKSSAARGRNIACDLWPEFHRLIATAKPHAIIGEQIANCGCWFDGVWDDVGALDYSVGAAVLPACSIGKDHARERLFFVFHADDEGEPRQPVNAEMAGMPRTFRSGRRDKSREDGLSVESMVRRGAGNAIVPQVAAQFIGAYMDAANA